MRTRREYETLETTMYVYNDSHNVRVSMIDQKPWFAVTDVLKILDASYLPLYVKDVKVAKSKAGDRNVRLKFISLNTLLEFVDHVNVSEEIKIAFRSWLSTEFQAEDNDATEAINSDCTFDNSSQDENGTSSSTKTSNSLEIFNNSEFGNIRTIVIDGNPYFCGIDVAKALGYQKPNNALDRYCRYPLKWGVPHPQSQNKLLNVIFIPEADVYKLIFSSKLPSAERFTDWVTSKVLPALRKTGHYETPEFVNRVDQMFSMTAESIKALAENMTVLTNTMVQLKEVQESHSAKIINLEEAVRKLQSSAADSFSDYDQEDRQAETNCKYDNIDPRKYGIDPDSENWRMQVNLLVRKIAIKRGVRVADIWRSVYTILARDYQVNLEDELQKRRTEMHKKHISESKIEALNKLMIADENPDLKLWIAWIICGIYRGVLVA